MWQVWIAGVVVIMFVGALIVVARRRQRFAKTIKDLEAAKQRFRRRREWLEAKFVTLASQSGRPRGLSWKNCDFADDVTFARDRQSGSLQALIAVTIQFEAEEGGGMEHVEAVARLRAATAVFQFDGEQWETAGRVVFNLTPTETIKHFRHELERLDVA